MITSAANIQVKNIIHLNKKPKLRNEQGLFVVEGLKMFLEAPLSQIEKVYVSQSFAAEVVHQETLYERMQKEKWEVVEEKIFKSMSDTMTPQGILCIMKQFSYTLEDILEKEKNPLFVVLEDLQDPGNLGTILRTGEGAGVTGVILSRNCVDIYNPKTIRATMGSLYRMPFVYVDSLEEVWGQLEKRKVTTYAAHLHGERSYDQEDYQKGSAILIGNEGNGLSEQTAKAADCLIKIPMCGEVESLNAAMAAGILLYEAARQRRSGT